MSKFKIKTHKYFSFGTMIENVMAKLQIMKIKSHKVTRLGDGTKAVLVSNQILKFHESDARPMLAAKFMSKIKYLGNIK